MSVERVLIGLPNMGTMVTETALCLAELAVYETAHRRPLRFLDVQTSLIGASRNAIVEAALEQEVAQILWIDSDMTFPMDGLERLRAHGVPVVGTNYPVRCEPARPTAIDLTGNYLQPKTGGLEEVHGIGFGFCLTSVEVFRAMPRPWFADEWNGQILMGEDSHFCLRTPARVMVDHALSWEIGHVGRKTFTWADLPFIHKDTMSDGRDNFAA